MTFKEELIENNKRVICPVEWICKRLNKKITVKKNCVYYNGWICDCNYNVKDDDIFHKVTLWGFAEDVNNIVDFNKKVNFFGFEKRIKPVCCECGIETTRGINGVFICKKCYGYDNGHGSKYFDEDVIRSCSFFDVNNNFKLKICKGCDRLNYCKKIVRKEKEL